MVSTPRKGQRTESIDGSDGPTTTRTSSRSAKRRSPKEPEPDPELLEEERTQFLRAIDRFKRRTGKTYPSWSDVLDVLREIGWVSPVQLEAERRKTEPVA
jgi:hypothetical protein